MGGREAERGGTPPPRPPPGLTPPQPGPDPSVPAAPPAPAGAPRVGKSRKHAGGRGVTGAGAVFPVRRLAWSDGGWRRASEDGEKGLAEPRAPLVGRWVPARPRGCRCHGGAGFRLPDTGTRSQAPAASARAAAFGQEARACVSQQLEQPPRRFFFFLEDSLEHYYTISTKKKRWLCLTSSATSATSSAARCPVFPGAQAPPKGSRDLRAQAGVLRGASSPPGSPSLGPAAAGHPQAC